MNVDKYEKIKINTIFLVVIKKKNFVVKFER